MKTKHPFLILSLTGGGVLCYRQLLILRAIRDALYASYGRPVDLNALCGLVAGTSAGSIIAVGIRAGLELEEIQDLFRELGTKVFPRGLKRWLGWIWRGPLHGDLSIPRYDPGPLYRLLRENLSLPVGGKDAISGEPRPLLFGDLKGYTLAIAISIERKPIVFENWLMADALVPAWLVSAASSAAHTYFPPVEVLRAHGVDYARDGGYGQNDPCNVALTAYEQIHGTRAEDSNIISLVVGKGKVPFNPAPESVRSWGIIDEAIAGDIVNGFIVSNEEFSRYEAERRTPAGRFLFFNPPFVHATSDMADARRKQFDAHERDVAEYLSQQGTQQKITGLVKLLGSHPMFAGRVKRKAAGQ